MTTIEEQAQSIFGDKYPRQRPFLVMTELSRPSANTKTEKKGWKTEEGKCENFEMVTIVDRVQSSHLRSAALVIDLLNRKIIKNRHADAGTEEQFLNYYMDKYADKITEGLRIWAHQSALNVSEHA